MTRRRPSAYWLCQLAGWGLYVAFTIVQTLGVLGATARTFLEPTIAAALGIALTDASRRLAGPRLWLGRSHAGLLWRVVLASTILASLLVGILATIELGLYGDRPDLPAAVIGFAVIRWTLMMFVWHALYVGFALIRQRQRDELERGVLDHALQAARLRTLESALNPHFLFNALNTVRALVAEDAARADAAIIQLARLLRYALAAGRAELVTVAHELSIVDDYLAIERLRLDARLVIERDVSDAAIARWVPAMVVQTLVENAIKHGIARLPEGGTLRIVARVLADGALAIEIENPRAPKTEAAESPGIGLANATERLRLLCGPRASLALELSSQRAIARLSIPEGTP